MTREATPVLSARTLTVLALNTPRLVGTVSVFSPTGRAAREERPRSTDCAVRRLAVEPRTANATARVPVPTARSCQTNSAVSQDGPDTIPSAVLPVKSRTRTNPGLASVPTPLNPSSTECAPTVVLPVKLGSTLPPSVVLAFKRS